nr:MAG TPA: hypothetical protein [Caudoviricetes sp.]
MAMTQIPFTQIRDQLGFKSVTQVRAAVKRMVDARAREVEFRGNRVLDIERLDVMFARAFQKATDKDADLKAIETCIRLQERRAALVDDPAPAQLVAAYERTIEALNLEGEDSALVESGRAVAQQIDYVLAHGTPSERTKSLYLIPHLTNTLRELGATPEARKAISTLGETEVKKSKEPSALEVLQRRAQLKAVQ